MTQPIDTAGNGLQSGDSVSELTNDSGYKTTKTITTRGDLSVVGAASLRLDGIVFIADTSYTVSKITYVASAASATGGATWTVYRDSGTDAPGGGDLITTFAADGTANTVQDGTLTNTSLVEGDRITVVNTNTVGDYGSAAITITLE